MMCLDETKGKEKNQSSNLLKYQQKSAQNDRQSRLQRRQEAKDSKEKAAKTAKPTLAASK